MAWPGGQKFSELFLKFFVLAMHVRYDKLYWVGQNFQKIFVLGQLFSRTKIPVTGPTLQKSLQKSISKS